MAVFWFKIKTSSTSTMKFFFFFLVLMIAGTMNLKSYEYKIRKKIPNYLL